MLAVKGESRDGCVVEALLIERPQLAIDAGMLGVARHAIALDVSMHSAPFRDAFGDWPVTGQTLFSGHSLTTLVAGLAVGQPLQIRVRLRKPPR
jgi:hypothetical protein